MDEFLSYLKLLTATVDFIRAVWKLVELLKKLRKRK